MPPSHSADGAVPHVVGVMRVAVEATADAGFEALVERAVQRFREALRDLSLRVDLLAFDGPHLTPNVGTYAPLDFLHLGISEKLERRIPFLLIVTEVDLTASTLAYVLALPSQLTNVGIVSTKRLDPTFWGDREDEDLAVRRLTALLLHTFGHLLNLDHSTDPGNAMYDFERVEDLDRMQTTTATQRKRMEENLVRESHEGVSPSRPSVWTRGRLSLRWTLGNLGSLGAAVARANPFRLLTRLPTLLTAALSVIIVVFFSAEVWDVASTIGTVQLAVFSLVAVAAATAVLYKAFSFGRVLSRDRLLAESTVVTTVATALALFLTMLLVYTLFFGLTYFGTVTVFPHRLMATWPTVDPATRTVDHLKLSAFLASIGVLAGSLGGRADSKDVVRTVLFIDEET
jgi:predicted Zn-dependent protease